MATGSECDSPEGAPMTMVPRLRPGRRPRTEATDDPLGDGGGAVLGGDRELAGLPACADVRHGGGQHVDEDVERRRARRERLLDDSS